MDILVASFQRHVLAILEVLLSDDPEMVVVGLAESVPDLLMQADATRPELILVEWDLLGPSQSDTICAIGNLTPPPVVVVYGRRSDWAPLALNAGADAFVWEGDGPIAILNAIREVDRRQGK